MGGRNAKMLSHTNGRRRPEDAARMLSHLSGRAAPRLKIVLLGDPKIGRTSFVLRYIDNTFSETPSDFSEFSPNVATRELYLASHDKDVKIEIWDNERVEGEVPQFYSGAKGFIILYDITNKSSFDSISKWEADAQKFCSVAPYFIVGLKADLEAERTVSYQTAKTDIGLRSFDDSPIPYFEVSAKDPLRGASLEHLFEELAKAIIDRTED